MGMFSFLTGSKDERATEAPATGTSAAAPTTPAPVSPSVEAAPAQAALTPVTAPDAWNTEALTSPRPESAKDALEVGPLDTEQTAALQGKIVEAIKTVFDPEIPVDIYELGLIYDIIVDAERCVLINMTLTSPACPSAQQIPSEVRLKVKAIPGITDAKVEIGWEPPWTKDRMSEVAKLTLGF